MTTPLLLHRWFVGHANAFRTSSCTFRSQQHRRSMTQLHGGGAPRKTARSRRKDDNNNNESAATQTLEWETFEYTDSPKWDRRFDQHGNGDLYHLPSNHHDKTWEQMKAQETRQDEELQATFAKIHGLWDSLDPELVQQATDLLIPFVSSERWERIQTILKQRTQHTRFLFENPANPSNVWACLRTLDSFGIQHVDVVIQSGNYKGKAALSQKRGMRTAMGSAKWLTLKNHLCNEHALEEIKKEGYHIICTDVNPESKDIRNVDWDASGKPVCVVMGNEQYGISDAVKEMADESFYLPMSGMAESFNLSVATAITCAHLSAVSKDGKGPLRPGDLSDEEYKTLLLKGALNSVKHKTARALFRKHGLDFPNGLNLS